MSDTQTDTPAETVPQIAARLVDALDRLKEAQPDAQAIVQAEWDARGHDTGNSTGFFMQVRSRASRMSGVDIDDLLTDLSTHAEDFARYIVEQSAMTPPAAVAETAEPARDDSGPREYGSRAEMDAVLCVWRGKVQGDGVHDLTTANYGLHKGQKVCRGCGAWVAK